MQTVGLAVDEAVGGEILGVDDRAVDIGEDLELVGDARVIAVGGEAVADAALAPLRFDERLDHAVGRAPARESSCRKGCSSGVSMRGRAAVSQRPVHPRLAEPRGPRRSRSVRRLAAVVTVTVSRGRSSRRPSVRYACSRALDDGSVRAVRGVRDVRPAPARRRRVADTTGGRHGRLPKGRLPIAYAVSAPAGVDGGAADGRAGKRTGDRHPALDAGPGGASQPPSSTA